MKRFLPYIIPACLVLLAACNDGYDPQGSIHPSLSARYLRASETTFESYSASAQSFNFSVESLNTPWRFGEAPAWITLDPAQGSASADVTLSTGENQSADAPRTGIFYLQSAASDWTYSQAMSVSQAAATPFITADITSVELPGTGGTATVTLESNYTWEATCSYDWITLGADPASGTLTITATANPDNYYRTAYVYVGNVTIYVKQFPTEITSSQTTLACTNAASRYEVEISAEIDWEATTSDTWLDVQPARGDAGTSKVAVEVAPNEEVYSRTGYVYFKSGTTSKLQLTVNQDGLVISADPSLAFTSPPSTQKLNITSNTTWSVLNAPTWVSITPASGEGNAAIDVTVADNPSMTSRRGTITVGHPGLNLSYDVAVTQAGKYFDAGTSRLEFDADGGILTFDIKSDAAWTSVLSDDWFSATPLTGKGDARISVSATANNSTDERTGIIRYDFVEESAAVNIHQLAKYFTIDNSTFEFTSRGGSHTVDFSSNDSWTAAVAGNADWLTLSATSGKGSGTITITAADNPSVNVRSATVIITPANAQAVQRLVSQRLRTLELSARSVVFFAKGGTSAPVTVTTDGTFKVTQDGDWFTVNAPQDGSFTLTATPNSSKEARRGTITVALTDLTEGSLAITIPVIQGGQGCSFVIDTYPDQDTDWLPASDGSLTVTVTGYAADRNWNSTWNSGMTISVTGYTTDKDWNRTHSSACHATVTVYGAEKNWTPTTGSNGSFSSTAFGNENNWNE